MSFERWVASYAGCDGGDLVNSNIWLVGIEWGYGNYEAKDSKEHEDEIRQYHSGEMLNDINRGAGQCDNAFRLQDNLKYTFGLNTAKLICAIKGFDISEYSTKIEDFGDNEVFKANLYPVALPNHNDEQWQKYQIAKYTGIQTKAEYRQFCETYRFPFFRSELIKYKPKLVLCMGVSYVREFHRCFTAEKNTKNLYNERIFDSAESNSTVRNFYWRWINQETLFVVTPFPMNASGLNSENLLQQFGDRINALLEQGFVKRNEI